MPTPETMEGRPVSGAKELYRQVQERTGTLPPVEGQLLSLLTQSSSGPDAANNFSAFANQASYKLDASQAKAFSQQGFQSVDRAFRHVAVQPETKGVLSLLSKAAHDYSVITPRSRIDSDVAISGRLAFAHAALMSFCPKSELPPEIRTSLTSTVELPQYQPTVEQTSGYVSTYDSPPIEKRFRDAATNKSAIVVDGALVVLPDAITHPTDTKKDSKPVLNGVAIKDIQTHDGGVIPAGMIVDIDNPDLTKLIQNTRSSDQRAISTDDIRKESPFKLGLTRVIGPTPPDGIEYARSARSTMATLTEYGAETWKFKQAAPAANPASNS